MQQGKNYSLEKLLLIVLLKVCAARDLSKPAAEIAEGHTIEPSAELTGINLDGMVCLEVGVLDKHTQQRIHHFLERVTR